MNVDQMPARREKADLLKDEIPFWAIPESELFLRLRAQANGLSVQDAAERLTRFGSNEVTAGPRFTKLRVLWNQVRSPLLLILFFAAFFSAWTGEWTDAVIVLAILVGSIAVGFFREYQAETAAAKLRSRLRTTVRTLRDGRQANVDARDIVPGDVVLLAAGNLVPGDARILESKDFYVNESILTGETFPSEKRVGILPSAHELSKRANSIFMGTNVRSGTARCLIVRTGLDTEFGAIARHLSLAPPEAEFDRGLRRFGGMLTASMLVIILAVFTANVLLQRPISEALLFSIALAVGLSPELLPAILNVNLARGAQLMARSGVLVRRLNAIENLGSMNVLCTDKTGTLTEGVVEVDGFHDWRGRPSIAVRELAVANSYFQSGLANPLDEAILAQKVGIAEGVKKIGEIPYDFVRRRMSVVVNSANGGAKIITKGAFRNVLDTCTRISGEGPLTPEIRGELERRHDEWTASGIRVLAVASGRPEPRDAYSIGDERDLTFAGFATFLDRPKPGAAEAIEALRNLGVSVKMITGDSAQVARFVATKVGLDGNRLLTGRDLDEFHEEALWQRAQETHVFAEVDPNQKERIILALKRMGHVVGFLGDGINDAPAMHSADTSLSVDRAVDVAREAADFVLLERDLDIIRKGVLEGRRTFSNTLKYVLLTMSANLGNMLSMAVASVVLPFLPLTAGQVLLNNFLSDLPAVGLADDAVDPELVARPRRWDIRFIGSFMTVFGLLSSLFDFLTFACLLRVYSAGVETFRTGWFVESLVTEVVVALLVRTRRPFYRSRPGSLLLWSSIAVALLAFAIPYLPWAGALGLTPLPAGLLFAIVTLTAAYATAAEVAKAAFYRVNRRE